MNEKYILTAKDVTKRYDKYTALDGISFHLEKGGIYGLIGRNGAGKTTLLKMIDKQLFVSEGSIVTSVGTSLSKDYQIYFKSLKVKNIFELAKEQHPKWNDDLASKLIKTFDVKLKKQYDKLSRGNQNLISIIITLCSNEDILLFDEPYTGLDPINRDLIYKELIRQNIDDEKTIILSSHLISELETMINHVIMIHDSKILIDKEMDNLKTKSFELVGPKEILEPLIDHMNIINKQYLNNQLTAHVFNRIHEKDEKIICENGCQISALSLQQLIVSLTTSKEDVLC